MRDTGELALRSLAPLAVVLYDDTPSMPGVAELVEDEENSR